MSNIKKFNNFISTEDKKKQLIKDSKSYIDILTKYGYIFFGTTWLKKETENNIHYAWLWSNHKIKMVGYKKIFDESDNYTEGDKLYSISPEHEMNDEILKSILQKNVIE